MIIAAEEINKSLKGIADDSWYTVHTLGDGSCLIHSILYAFCNKYRSSGPSERSNLVTRIRRRLAAHLENEYDKLDYVQHKDFKEYTKENMQKTLLSREYLNYAYIKYFINIFKTNIIVVYYHDKSYQRYPLDLPYEQDKTIVIYYDKKKQHFETLLYKIEDKYISVFRPDDELLKVW